MQGNSNPRLFSFDIRIANKIVNLPVYQKDNKEILFKRLMEINPIENIMQEKLKKKLISALELYIKNNNVTRHIVEKINFFL
jgi:hypothetical protein